MHCRLVLTQQCNTCKRRLKQNRMRNAKLVSIQVCSIECKSVFQSRKGIGGGAENGQVGVKPPITVYIISNPANNSNALDDRNSVTPLQSKLLSLRNSTSAFHLYHCPIYPFSTTAVNQYPPGYLLCLPPKINPIAKIAS